MGNNLYRGGNNFDNKLDFIIYEKEELLNLLTKKSKIQKKYITFLNLYKNDYLITLSKKYNTNLINYIKDDSKFILNSDSGSKLYYIFAIKGMEPIAITKILTLFKEDNYYKPIIQFINKQFNKQLKNNEWIYLHNTYVHPSYRGKGINNQLLQYILNNFKHIKYVIVAIKDTNISSIKSRLKQNFIKTNILMYQPDVYFYYKNLII